MLTRIEKSSVLLVEGKTDEWFFQSLLHRLGRTGTQIIDVRGLPHLPGMVERVGSDPYFRAKGRRLAIARDADRHAVGAFDSVCASLARVALPCPTEAGLWTTGELSVGVFVFPDNRNGGMLESLCLEAEAQARRACVARFAECVAELGTPAPGAKEAMQALLAISGVGNPQAGAAARENYFDWEVAAFDSLRAFVSVLD